jgi:AcrR family transcriptional regulator
MPSKADITKAHILDAAAALFNQQGYAGTSMADLMAATGLKKGGFTITSAIRTTLPWRPLIWR